MANNKVYLGNIKTKLGEKIIPLEQIANQFGKDYEKARRSTGVKRLHYFNDSQSLLRESVSCAKESISGRKIDGIYAATCTPSSEFLLPSYASQIAHELEMSIPAHTVNFGCAAIGYAIKAAYNQTLVDSAQEKKSSYLVVVGDHISKILEDEWETRALFSDAVGSFIISNEPLEYELNSAEIKQIISRNPYSMNVPANGLKFHMKSRETYKFVRNKVMPTFLEMTPNIGPKSIIIPHAASKKSIDGMKKNDLPCALYDNGMKEGNTQVVSTLFGLQDPVNKEYDDIYLLPFGAEMAIGSIHLKRN
jgi:3-oxoacyl-[acyl-carrier-protein] synthase III